MTVQEAKGFIQGKLDCMDKCDVFECKSTDECENCNYCYSQGTFGEQEEAFEFAIKCMKEVEQYRALGTVEELKENKDFLEFLYNKIQPNEMEQYLQMYNAKDTKTLTIEGYAYQCGLMSAT